MWKGKRKTERHALGISVGLSAAPARSLEPGSSLPEVEVIWSGRGTDGMRLCLPASLGMVVPVTAQSEREPPTWGSSLLEDEDWAMVN